MQPYPAVSRLELAEAALNKLDSRDGDAVFSGIMLFLVAWCLFLAFIAAYVVPSQDRAHNWQISIYVAFGMAALCGIFALVGWRSYRRHARTITALRRPMPLQQLVTQMYAIHLVEAGLRSLPDDRNRQLERWQYSWTLLLLEEHVERLISDCKRHKVPPRLVRTVLEE